MEDRITSTRNCEKPINLLKKFIAAHETTDILTHFAGKLCDHVLPGDVKSIVHVIVLYTLHARTFQQHRCEMHQEIHLHKSPWLTNGHFERRSNNMKLSNSFGGRPCLMLSTVQLSRTLRSLPLLSRRLPTAGTYSRCRLSGLGCRKMIPQQTKLRSYERLGIIVTSRLTSVNGRIRFWSNDIGMTLDD